MSEERKKKSEAAWKAKEDEELYKSRAFVELTEYIANAVENDTHSFYLPNFISFIRYIQRHTLCNPTSVSLPSSFGATIYDLLFLVCFNMPLFTCFCFAFSNLDVDRIDATLHLFTTVVILISNLIATRTQFSFLNSRILSRSVL